MCMMTFILLVFMLNKEKTYHNFTISCFNCYGFKGSLGYVTKLVNECDITFFCEHWQ